MALPAGPGGGRRRCGGRGGPQLGCVAAEKALHVAAQGKGARPLRAFGGAPSPSAGCRACSLLLPLSLRTSPGFVEPPPAPPLPLRRCLQAGIFFLLHRWRYASDLWRQRPARHKRRCPLEQGPPPRPRRCSPPPQPTLPPLLPPPPHDWPVQRDAPERVMQLIQVQASSSAAGEEAYARLRAAAEMGEHVVTRGDVEYLRLQVSDWAYVLDVISRILAALHQPGAEAEALAAAAAGAAPRPLQQLLQGLGASTSQFRDILLQARALPLACRRLVTVSQGLAHYIVILNLVRRLAAPDPAPATRSLQKGGKDDATSTWSTGLLLCSGLFETAIRIVLDALEAAGAASPAAFVLAERQWAERLLVLLGFVNAGLLRRVEWMECLTSLRQASVDLVGWQGSSGSGAGVSGVVPGALRVMPAPGASTFTPTFLSQFNGMTVRVGSGV